MSTPEVCCFWGPVCHPLSRTVCAAFAREAHTFACVLYLTRHNNLHKRGHHHLYVHPWSGKRETPHKMLPLPPAMNPPSTPCCTPVMTNDHPDLKQTASGVLTHQDHAPISMLPSCCRPPTSCLCRPAWYPLSAGRGRSSKGTFVDQHVLRSPLKL